MNNQLYRKRSFSDKFNLAFQWFRDNWKPLLKYQTLLLLPLSLVQAYGLSAMMGMAQMSNTALNGAMSGGAVMSMLLMYLVGFVGAILSFSLVFALLKKSFIDGEELQGIRFSEVWGGMKSNMGRLFLGIIFFSFLLVVVSAIVVGLAVWSEYTLLLTLPALIALCFAFVPFFPLYLLTDEPLLEACSHALRLGFKCWWGFFSTLLVMGLLANVLQGFGAIPFYACIFVKMLMASDSAGTFENLTLLMDFLSYLSGVIMCYVAYVLSALTVLISCIQYGHAADKVDGVSADAEIDNF